jgi:hypothetical protein
MSETAQEPFFLIWLKASGLAFLFNFAFNFLVAIITWTEIDSLSYYIFDLNLYVQLALFFFTTFASSYIYIYQRYDSGEAIKFCMIFTLTLLILVPLLLIFYFFEWLVLFPAIFDGYMLHIT